MNTKKVVSLEDIKKMKSKMRSSKDSFTETHETMLYLIEEDPYKVDYKTLEKTCGNGETLVDAIDQKIKLIEKARESGDVDQVGWENMALMAVGSVYGIDIKKDNCDETRERMLNVVLSYYKNAYADSLEGRLSSFTSALKYILDKNIIHGDGLTGMKNDGSPIILSDWELISREEIIRKDYEMNKVIEHNKEELKPTKTTIYTYGSVFSS